VLEILTTCRAAVDRDGPFSEAAMANRSRMSVQKRKRERKKAEKAAAKRARRHGATDPDRGEPQPTVRLGELLGRPADNQEREGERDDQG